MVETEEMSQELERDNILDSGRSIDGIDISSYLYTENSDMMMEMECLPQLMLKYEPLTVPKSVGFRVNGNDICPVAPVAGSKRTNVGALDILDTLCNR